MFAAAFTTDPVFDWIARPGPKRARLERFFFWLLRMRAMPFGEVWMADDGRVCAAWLPPGTPGEPGGLMEQMRADAACSCGLRIAAPETRLSHGGRRWRRIIRTSTISIWPSSRWRRDLQGMGLGAAMLEATLKRVDEQRPAYLENSNPRNAKLYERAGFVAAEASPPRTLRR